MEEEDEGQIWRRQRLMLKIKALEETIKLIENNDESLRWNNIRGVELNNSIGGKNY